jgi:hypothetical protein
MLSMTDYKSRNLSFEESFYNNMRLDQNLAGMKQIDRWALIEINSLYCTHTVLTIQGGR